MDSGLPARPNGVNAMIWPRLDMTHNTQLPKGTNEPLELWRDASIYLDIARDVECVGVNMAAAELRKRHLVLPQCRL